MEVSLNSVTIACVHEASRFSKELHVLLKMQFAQSGIAAFALTLCSAAIPALN